MRNLHDWVILSDFHERLQEVNAAAPSAASEAFAAHVLEMEALWPGLTPEDPELDTVLTHDLTEDLRKSQGINPNFVEIFVTDATGTLVATTNKTTDYWQANERWWQKGWRSGFQSAHIEGINYDASAGVYSVDLAIPIRNPLDPEAAPAGVAKAVVQASNLFFGLAAISESVLKKLVSFTRSSTFPDDICFVSVGVEKNDYASLAVAAQEGPGHRGSA